MDNEQSRTDATSRDRSPDHQYTLTVEQVAELYAAAGLPRDIRTIQKYCALNKLDRRKVDTDIGVEKKYLVAPYSVERHIAYIKEMQSGATSRAKTRTVASVRPLENKDEQPERTMANSNEQPRPDATVRAADDRYVASLERENSFLREQVGVKDTQIGALLERDKETNTLIHRLQAMLAPLLTAPSERPRSTPPTEPAE